MITLSNFPTRTIIKLSSFFNIHLTTSYERKLNKYRQQLFNKLGIDMALDVGANKGGYALSLLNSGFEGKILSFEPIGLSYFWRAIDNSSTICFINRSLGIMNQPSTLVVGICDLVTFVASVKAFGNYSSICCK